MKIRTFTFNFFSENTYILYDETGECVIVDPGCYFAEEETQLTGFISQNNLSPVKLLNTHCHIDHIFGNSFVAHKYNIPLYCHTLEVEWLEQGPHYGQAMYNVRLQPSPAPAGFLAEGDEVTFGNTTLQVLFTPGHSQGSITFYNAASKTAIVGDVIFNRSVGRTDLPGGNFATLENSIKTKIYTLPNDTVLYAGHMEPTTVGEEKMHNPFVRG
jgi:hydroxyacylglutathione hydrolase